MKNRIPTFDDFIYEAAYVPDTQFVYKILNKIKNKLLNADNIGNMDKILNDAFNNRWMLILHSETEDAACLNSVWSIDAANTSVSSGDDDMIVTIVLGKNFFEKIKSIKSIADWKYFVDAFEAIVAHEYVHKYQMPNIPYKTIKKMWGGDISAEDYVSIKQEVMAFALQCVKEFMMRGYSPQDVIDKIRKPGISKPADNDSDIWRTYKYFFNYEDGTWKRFAKYIYEYCMNFLKK